MKNACIYKYGEKIKRMIGIVNTKKTRKVAVSLAIRQPATGRRTAPFGRQRRARRTRFLPGTQTPKRFVRELIFGRSCLLVEDEFLPNPFVRFQVDRDRRWARQTTPSCEYTTWISAESEGNRSRDLQELRQRSTGRNRGCPRKSDILIFQAGYVRKCRSIPLSPGSIMLRSPRAAGSEGQTTADRRLFRISWRIVYFDAMDDPHGRHGDWNGPTWRGFRPGKFPFSIGERS